MDVTSLPMALRGDLFRWPDGVGPNYRRWPDCPIRQKLIVSCLPVNWAADPCPNWDGNFRKDKLLEFHLSLMRKMGACDRLDDWKFVKTANDFSTPVCGEVIGGDTLFDLLCMSVDKNACIDKGPNGDYGADNYLPIKLFRSYLDEMKNLGVAVFDALEAVEKGTAKAKPEKRWVYPCPPLNQCVSGRFLKAIATLKGTEIPLDERWHVDLAKLPHLLVAGSTGSGKSVFLESLILTLVLNNHPDELNLLLIDPKKVELSRFSGLRHLWAAPGIMEDDVCTEPGDVPCVLEELADEMERRLDRMKDKGVRDLKEYNQATGEGMPRIVCVIDEFADLSLQLGKPFTQPLERLAAKARASGIHLVLATQKPTRDVVSPLIKANVPARVAFRVACATDSRVILDRAGAEELSRPGEGIFIAPGMGETRFVGAYGGDDAVRKAMDALKPRWEETAPVEPEKGLAKNVWKYLVDAFWLRKWMRGWDVPQRFPDIGEGIDMFWKR